MTAIFYDSLIFPYIDSGRMERAASNHGEDSLSSITLRLSLPHVKIDNHENLMGSRDKEWDKTTGEKNRDRQKSAQKKNKLAFQEGQIMSFVRMKHQGIMASLSSFLQKIIKKKVWCYLKVLKNDIWPYACCLCIPSLVVLAAVNANFLIPVIVSLTVYLVHNECCEQEPHAGKW